MRGPDAWITRRISSLSALWSPFARTVSGTVVLQGSLIASNFLISLLLARLLGAAGYGAYAYAIAWANLLVVFALLGMEQLAVREIARYKTQAAWGELRGLIRWSTLVTLAAAIGLGSCGAFLAWLVADQLDPRILGPFWIAMALLPLITLVRMMKACLSGLKHVAIGLFPESVIQPALFISLVVLSFVLLRDALSSSWVLGLHLASFGIALLYGARQLLARLPKPARQARAAYAGATWIRSALPMLFVGGMEIVNARVDAIILGALKGAEAAGIYIIASRGAELVMFVMVAVNMALQPSIASLYAGGETERLQRLVTRSARLKLLGALPVALAFIFFGYWFLALFGAEFTRGENALAILCVGQLINVGAGSAAMLLIMTKHESLAMLGVTLGVCANIALNLILIPRYGIEGAAIATMVSIALASVVSAVLVIRIVGLHPTALGRIGFGR